MEPNIIQGLFCEIFLTLKPVIVEELDMQMSNDLEEVYIGNTKIHLVKNYGCLINIGKFVDGVWL